MQLIILGMHRSGTSMQTRLLNLAGAYFGPEGVNTGANDENPKGFWERRDVRALNDGLLHAAGCDWDRAVDFDPDRVPAEARDHFDRAAARLVLDMDGHRPWVLKEPRLCLLLSMWQRHLECPVGVHVFRHPVEVASSLLRRNGMPIEVGLALWKLYVCASIRGSGAMPCVTSFHQDFVADPVAAMGEMIELLQQAGVSGLRLPSRPETEAFVARDLYRERLQQLDIDPRMAARQVELFEEIRRTRTLPPDCALSEEEVAELRRYEASLPALEPGRVEKGSTSTKDAEQAVKELSASLSRVNKAVTRRDGRINALEREVAARVDEVAVTREELRSAQAWLEDQKIERATLEIKLGRAEASAANATRDSARKTVEITRLTRLLVSRERQLQEQTSQVTILKDSVGAARRQLEARAGEIATLRMQLDASAQRHRAQVEALDTQLARMQRSMGWRLGAPVRWVKRRIAIARGIGLHGDVRRVLDSGLFDRAWYARTYPDVAESGIEPVEHYLLHGASEGRDPGPGFCTSLYLERYPDVGGSGMNPLLHFIRHGRSEGRLPH